MSNSLLALVLLDTPATPDMSALAKALRARHPELATDVAENGDAQQAEANSPLIRCGNELVAVMSMPARIPDDPGLWSRASTTWPQAKAAAARHPSDERQTAAAGFGPAQRRSDALDCGHRRIDCDGAGIALLYGM